MINGPGEIPDNLIAPIVQPPAAPIHTQPERRTQPEADRTVQAPDRVELSPRAREVQSLVQAAQAEPEVRPQVVEHARRVQQAEQALPDVPAAKVAEKLLLEG